MLKKVKALAARVWAPVKKHGAALMALGLVGIQAAHAALPASATTTIADVGTDGQSMFDLVFPVIGTFVGLSLVIKLFKRFTRAI